MRNYRIFAAMSAMAVVAALFAGCTKEDISKRKAIGFKVASQDTKSTIYTTDNIAKELKAFQIDLYDATDGVTAILNSDGDQVVGEGVSYDAGEWLMDHITYWEKQTINSWAYANAAPTTRGKDSQSFFFETKDKAENQEDVLYAYTPNRTMKDDDGMIPIHFYHALSAIQFQFGAKKDGGRELETGDDVILTKITINNIVKNGTCTFDTNEKFTWDLKNQSANENVYQTYDQSVTPGDMVGSEKTGDMSFLLVPQSMNTNTGHESSVTIDWTKNGVAKESRTTLITKKDGKTVTWEPGKRYLYTIRIEKNSASLSLDLEVLPWEVDTVEVAYNHALAVAENGGLAFSDCDITVKDTTTSLITFKDSNTPIKVEFKLSQPEYGTWLVSLTNSADFEIFTDLNDKGKGGTLASGSIGALDGTGSAVFYILPKAGLDRTVNHSTKIKISAMRTDGVTISADDKDLLNSGIFEIVLPAND